MSLSRILQLNKNWESYYKLIFYSFKIMILNKNTIEKYIDKDKSEQSF